MKKLSDLKPSKRNSRSPSRISTTVNLLVDLGALRKSKGVTLEQVGQAMSLSCAAICHVERGCTPSIETALRYAAFVELPVEKIWALKRKKA